MNSFGRTRLSVSLLGAFVFFIASSAWFDASSASTAPSVSLSSRELQRDASVRKNFGLDSSVAAIEQAAADPAQSSPIGVPITPGEAAEMDRRNTVGLSLGSVDDSMISLQPSTYAGSWLDQVDGGVAVVQTTADPSTVPIAKIKSLLPSGAALTIRQVAASTTQLNSLLTSIDANWSRLRDQGIRIDSDGIFVDDDVVRVTLASDSLSDDASLLYEQYGHAGLDVVTNPGSFSFTALRNQGDGPLYGGMRIVEYPSGSTTGTACTSTLTVKASNGNTYGITAGHCGQAGWKYSEGGNGGDSLGSGSSRNGFYNSSSSDCDCTYFGPINSKYTHQVIIDNGSLYTFSKWAPNSNSYYTGRPACISGATTNDDMCDKLRSVTASSHGTEMGHTITLTDQIELYCSDRGGDSGAPIGNGPTWLGINSAGSAPSSTHQCGSTSDGTVIASRVMYMPSHLELSPDMSSE